MSDVRIQSSGLADAGPDYIIANCDRLFICSSQPATYAEAAGAKCLGTKVLTSDQFSKAAGDVSGRKLTLAQQSAILISASGTYTYYALGKSGTSELILGCPVDVAQQQALVANGLNTMTFPVTDVLEDRTPAAP